MRFDLYVNTTTELKNEGNTEVKEESIRQRHDNIEKENLKDLVNKAIDSIPENATGFFLEIHKNFDERMDDALMREPY